MIPRPVRNNNPFDIDNGPHWQGLMPTDKLTDVQKHERFAVFATPEDGFRAGVILLHNYKHLYGADTIRKIISRLAPPNENNTAAYEEAMTRYLGVGVDAPLDINNYATMFKAAKGITHVESGGWEPWWHDAQLVAGMGKTGFWPAARVA